MLVFDKTIVSEEEFNLLSTLKSILDMADTSVRKMNFTLAKGFKDIKSSINLIYI